MPQNSQILNSHQCNINQINEQQQQVSQSAQNNEKIVQQITINCLDKLLESSVAQTKMLSEIQKSQNSFENSLTSLIDSVSVLRNITHSIVKANDLKLQQTMQQQVNETLSQENFDQSSRHIPLNQNEMNSSTLLKFLNPQNTSFQYKLMLSEPLSLPLSREKNFNLNVQLVNRFNEKIVNSNRIPLSIQLYTCDSPPKRIEFNRTGQNVLKGVVEKDLVNGCTKFDKIHIKEVTSHFRNGWIFIVVYTKKSAFLKQSQQQNNAFYSNVIDYEDVQPLIIQQVKIRAKPLKEEKIKNKSININNTIQVINQISLQDNYIQKQIKKNSDEGNFNGDMCVVSV